MKNLKPFEIVLKLNKYIIGQNNAKKFVAIALRNRWRRQQISNKFREEIFPKNIILIGPTGVGKTEISRRLSKLTGSPFNKVDASKFTEVGYVGRDVESMIRDIISITIDKIKNNEQIILRKKANSIAEEKMLDFLIPKSENIIKNTNTKNDYLENSKNNNNSTREKFRKMLRSGKLNNRILEIDTPEQNSPIIEVFSGTNIDDIGSNVKDVLNSILPKNSKRKKMKVSDALEILIQEELQNLIDMDKIIKLSIKFVEESGIIFLDEIDKIISNNPGNSPNVSREGVQRDLLPIVEGTTVTTKYGPIKTDNILFIASGAFHTVKPSDLIPELQGRFPIRVELDSLKKEDFYEILTQPKNALLLQYTALLKTEGVNLIFENKGIAKLAELAEEINLITENIGARRLQTLLEQLLEEILFDAPSFSNKKICIDEMYINEKINSIKNQENLNKYIL